MSQEQVPQENDFSPEAFPSGKVAPSEGSKKPASHGRPKFVVRPIPPKKEHTAPQEKELLLESQEGTNRDVQEFSGSPDNQEPSQEEVERELRKQEFDPIRNYIRKDLKLENSPRLAYELTEEVDLGNGQKKFERRFFTNYHDLKIRERAPNASNARVIVKGDAAFKKILESHPDARDFVGLFEESPDGFPDDYADPDKNSDPGLEQALLEEARPDFSKDDSKTGWVDRMEQWASSIPGIVRIPHSQKNPARKENPDDTQPVPRITELPPDTGSTIPRVADHERELENSLRLQAALGEVSFEREENKSEATERGSHLVGARQKLIEDEIRLQQAIGRVPGKEKKHFERKVQRAALAHTPHLGDRELIQHLDKADFEQLDPAMRERVHDAGMRRIEFDRNLQAQGIENVAVRRSLYEVELSKLEYDNTRAVEAQTFCDERRIEINNREQQYRAEGNMGEIEFDVDAQVRAEAFQRFLVEERLILHRMRAETLPRQEQGMVKQAFERYRKLSRFQKIALGTAGAVGAVGMGSMLGVVSAGFAGAYAARRVVGAAAGGFGGLLGGEAVERVFGRGLRNELLRLEAQERTLGEDFSFESGENSVKQLRALEKEYEKIVEAEFGIQKRRAMLKFAGTMAGGLIAGYGVSNLMSHSLPHHEALGVSKIHPDSKALPQEAPPRAGTILQGKGIHGNETPLHRVSSLPDDRAHAGEGVWGPVRRQLEHQLHKNPGRFHIRKEDLMNPAKIDQILNAETAKALKANGFIDDHGETLRGVYKNGQVTIDESGKITVAQKDVYEFSSTHQSGDHAAPESGNVSSREPSSHEAGTIIKEYTPSGGKYVDRPEGIPREGKDWNEALLKANTPLDFARIELGKQVKGFDRFPPTAQEYALRWMEKRFAWEANKLGFSDMKHLVVAERARLEVGVAEALRASKTFESMMEIAGRFGDMTRVEVSLLERLGFSREYVFENTDYLTMIRETPVHDFLDQFPVAEHANFSNALIGKELICKTPDGVQHTLSIHESHLRLAEFLREKTLHSPHILETMKIKDALKETEKVVA